MQPTDNIDVTLQAQTWEMVMRVLAKGPYDVVAPIIQDIQNQCMRAQQPANTPRLVPGGLGPLNPPPTENDAVA
jgi:hypothetical protein